MTAHTPLIADLEGPVSLAFLPGRPLDIGTFVRRANGRVALVPPSMPLHEQVLATLWSMPRPEQQYLLPKPIAIAATGAIVRWGSYFAVLCDRSGQGAAIRHVSAAACPDGIRDAEMCRMNLEISTALTTWLRLARHDPDGFDDLALRALAYLPPTVPRLRRAERLDQFLGLPYFAARRGEKERDPLRRLGNHLALYSWRNGVIEDAHGGALRTVLTARQERTILREVGERFAGIFTGLAPIGGFATPRFDAGAELMLSLGYMGEPDWSDAPVVNEIVWHAADGWAEAPQVPGFVAASSRGPAHPAATETVAQ